jgi:hypothetical protein
MGSDPFGLQVKRKRDLAHLGFDAEEGDSSFMVMTWPSLFSFFFFNIFGS